jgi:transaldolase/glucose-6-phosphate isomerase
MYESVAGAFIEGLEDRVSRSDGATEIDGIASVASFFVSRIDTSVDKLLDEKMERASGSERQRLERLHGKIAIANARLAYQSYKRIFAGPRWEALAAQGARKQRLLWASTSVKNPRYRDVMYVEELIGADTIDTMPVETLTAFLDHGKMSASLERDVEQARATLEELEAAGISLRAVTDDLIVDGIKKFQEPYDKMIATLAIR